MFSANKLAVITVKPINLNKCHKYFPETLSSVHDVVCTLHPGGGNKNACFVSFKLY